MTNNNTLPSPDQPYVLAAGEGLHGHFLNHLATTKVAPGDTGLMSVVEFTAPRGFGPPLHLHDDEDELIIVSEGEIAFRSGDDESIATAGALAFLPRGVPHSFQVLSQSATMTSVTASTSGAPKFDRFVDALSTPLETTDLPEPVEIDGGRVAEVGLAHAITTLGPPPPPLD